AAEGMSISSFLGPGTSLAWVSGPFFVAGGDASISPWSPSPFPRSPRRSAVRHDARLPGRPHLRRRAARSAALRRRSARREARHALLPQRPAQHPALLG